MRQALLQILGVDDDRLSLLKVEPTRVAIQGSRVAVSVSPRARLLAEDASPIGAGSLQVDFAVRIPEGSGGASKSWNQISDGDKKAIETVRSIRSNPRRFRVQLASALEEVARNHSASGLLLPLLSVRSTKPAIRNLEPAWAAGPWSACKHAKAACNLTRHRDTWCADMSESIDAHIEVPLCNALPALPRLEVCNIDPESPPLPGCDSRGGLLDGNRSEKLPSQDIEQKSNDTSQPTRIWADDSSRNSNVGIILLVLTALVMISLVVLYAVLRHQKTAIIARWETAICALWKPKECLLDDVQAPVSLSGEPALAQELTSKASTADTAPCSAALNQKAVLRPDAPASTHSGPSSDGEHGVEHIAGSDAEPTTTSSSPLRASHDDIARKLPLPVRPPSPQAILTPAACGPGSSPPSVAAPRFPAPLTSPSAASSQPPRPLGQLAERVPPAMPSPPRFKPEHQIGERQTFSIPSPPRFLFEQPPAENPSSPSHGLPSLPSFPRQPPGSLRPLAPPVPSTSDVEVRAPEGLPPGLGSAPPPPPRLPRMLPPLSSSMASDHGMSSDSDAAASHATPREPATPRQSADSNHVEEDARWSGLSLPRQQLCALEKTSMLPAVSGGDSLGLPKPPDKVVARPAPPAEPPPPAGLVDPPALPPPDWALLE